MTRKRRYEDATDEELLAEITRRRAWKIGQYGRNYYFVPLKGERGERRVGIVDRHFYERRHCLADRYLDAEITLPDMFYQAKRGVYQYDCSSKEAFAALKAMGYTRGPRYIS